MFEETGLKKREEQRANNIGQIHGGPGTGGVAQ